MSEKKVYVASQMPDFDGMTRDELIQHAKNYHHQRGVMSEEMINLVILMGGISPGHAGNLTGPELLMHYSHAVDHCIDLKTVVNSVQALNTMHSKEQISTFDLIALLQESIRIINNSADGTDVHIRIAKMLAESNNMNGIMPILNEMLKDHHE